MRTWIRHIWEVLGSSYWFVPSVMIACSCMLAMVMLQVDAQWQPARPALQTLYTGSADGARALLSTIASSVITVAGVVFSITVAALTQASSQYGPRLLRNFMRDRGNQIVLGTFTSTFVYCILVVRTIRGEDHDQFVPNFSVSIAVGLGLLSIGVLIYFIHHVSRGLQAPIVAANAAAELRTAIIATFPDAGADAASELSSGESALLRAIDHSSQRVLAPRSGYLQALDDQGLLEIAREHDLIIRVQVRPGDFIVERGPVACVSAPKPFDRKALERIAGAFIIGGYTTAEQDVEFSIRQLVEVACRALSPGINDPFTAIECVDWLSEAACLACRRSEPCAYRRDEQGQLRLVMRTWDFAGLVDAAFNPIRQSAINNVPVLIRMLDSIAAVAQCTRLQPQREALRKQAAAIGEVIERLQGSTSDQHDLRQRLQRTIQALDQQST